jgi:fucose permease
MIGVIYVLNTLIYLAFISLGLPDGLLGSAWPTMHPELGVPLSYAGIIAIIISGGTVVSSLLSDRMTKKLGTALVSAISVLMTAAAILGFSISGHFWMLCLWAIPYGLGAGAIDAALNNYVALHYTSRHMSWLHCFWGVGAMTSPYIMGFYLTRGFEWNNAYTTVALVHISIVIMLLFSLPLWKKKDRASAASPVKNLSQILKIRGVKYVLAALFGYCALEATAGLWASSYLVHHRGISIETAAICASLFFSGITAGRFISGLFSNKLGNTKMIKLGIIFIFIGIAAVWLPLQTTLLSLAGLIIIGLGSAPVFPSIIHSTKENFGIENSQAIIGIQMASAYTGSALIPPLFGLIATTLGVGLYPVFLLCFAVLVAVMSRRWGRL